MLSLWIANDARLKKIELPTAIHLAFDELQLGDLALCLAVRPRSRDRGGNSRFIFEHAIGEGPDEA